MKYTSRRQFLVSSALAFSSVRRAAGEQASSPLDEIGVQLYTVRSVLTAEPGRTLKALSEIGYREAEVIWATIDTIWPDLQNSGLQPVSVHLDSALFAPENRGKFTAAISRCRELGFKYAVYPYLPPNQRGGIDSFKALADTLNRAGEECRTAGLRLCYHNHAFEFQPLGTTTGMATLLNRTDKSLVGWEMDIFWVSVAGHNPVDELKKHSGRIQLLHLKNKAPDTPVQYTESVPRTAFRTVGDGVLDIPAILQSASAAGVQHYFVEQDQTQGDPVESLRQSYDYLRRLKRP